MQMLDGRGGDFQGGGAGQNNYPQSAPQNAPAPNQGGGYPQQGGAPQGGNYGGQGSQQPRPPQPAPQQGNQAPPPNQQNSSYGAPDPGNFDDFDDEIPF